MVGFSISYVEHLGSTIMALAFFFCYIREPLKYKPDYLYKTLLIMNVFQKVIPTFLHILPAG
jgi:hypothetical protein